MMNLLQEKAGYISIEAVIVSGLLLALGAWAWIRFYATSQSMIDTAIDLTSQAMDVKVSTSI